MRIGGRFQGVVERRRLYPVETTEYLINLGMVAKVVVTRWCFIVSLNTKYALMELTNGTAIRQTTKAVENEYLES